MTAQLSLWLGAGLLAVGLPLTAAQQPLNPTGAATEARIKKLLDDLDSPRFAVRERATKEVLAMQERALGPLKRALASPRSAEFAQRARGILRQLAIYEPGGAVVGGLKLRLTADRDTIKPGEAVTLTTTLCNLTDKPLTVQVGFSTCGNYFACGSTVRRVVPAGPKDKGPKELVPDPQFGVCATGARLMFATIPPKGLVSYEVTAPILRKGEKTFLSLSGGLSAPGYFLLEAPAGSTHTLRMALEIAPEDNIPLEQALDPKNARPPQPPPGHWSGKIRSNDVQVRILP
jgi:hypothetical protein